MQEVIVHYRHISSSQLLSIPILLEHRNSSYDVEIRIIEGLNDKINPGKPLTTLIPSRNRGDVPARELSHQDLLKSWGIEAFYELDGKKHFFMH